MKLREALSIGAGAAFSGSLLYLALKPIKFDGLMATLSRGKW